MEVQHCSTIEYNNVSHNLYVDGEHVAEVWNFDVDVDRVDIDEIEIDEDATTLHGEFKVVYTTDYELISIE